MNLSLSTPHSCCSPRPSHFHDASSTSMIVGAAIASTSVAHAFTGAARLDICFIVPISVVKGVPINLITSVTSRKSGVSLQRIVNTCRFDHWVKTVSFHVSSRCLSPNTSQGASIVRRVRASDADARGYMSSEHSMFARRKLGP